MTRQSEAANYKAGCRNIYRTLALQTIYHKTVGKRLEVALRTKALLIGILLPILSTASVLLTHYVITNKDRKLERSFLLRVAPYCYLDTLTYMMGAYWYLSCELLSHAAIILAENFQKVQSTAVLICLLRV